MANRPVFIATWRYGLLACSVGWERLMAGASALDAIEAGANAVEDDPDVHSVGYGSLPNADGVVELDAAIMDGPTHAAGAVAAMSHIPRPISVARRVMERTPHVMLAGPNARRFAIQEGFPEADQLSDYARERWLRWKLERSAPDVAHFEPPAQPIPAMPQEISGGPEDETHDTIGLCALDQNGDLAAGCTTGGLAWKVPGRVGDSPMIGAGLYVDNVVGAAAATGNGDEMLKACLSYRAVMRMEEGYSPQEACIESLRYLLRKRSPERHDFYSAAIIALRKDGEVGAAATASGFHPPDRLWLWAVARTPETEGQPIVTLHEGVYVTPDALLARLDGEAQGSAL